MLLDTCALLWLAHDQSNLSNETLQKMDEIPVLYTSAISGFEIGLKYRTGKLQLPMPPTDWFESLLGHHDITVLDLDMSICIKAMELPQIHKDPCDRFIIATAILNDIPIVTTDQRFSQYAEQNKKQMQP